MVQIRTPLRRWPRLTLALRARWVLLVAAAILLTLAYYALLIWAGVSLIRLVVDALFG